MADNALRSPIKLARQAVQEVIDRHHGERPEGVRRVEPHFGEDWTGAPAVFLHMFVDKGLEPTNEKIGQLNAFVRAMLDEIIDMELGYWPYSRTIEED